MWHVNLFPWICTWRLLGCFLCYFLGKRLKSAGRNFRPVGLAHARTCLRASWPYKACAWTHSCEGHCLIPSHLIFTEATRSTRSSFLPLSMALPLFHSKISMDLKLFLLKTPHTQEYQGKAVNVCWARGAGQSCELAAAA